MKRTKEYSDMFALKTFSVLDGTELDIIARLGGNEPYSRGYLMLFEDNTYEVIPVIEGDGQEKEISLILNKT